MSPLLSNETWTYVQYVQYGTFTFQQNLKPIKKPLLSNKTWNLSNTFTF